MKKLISNILILFILLTLNSCGLFTSVSKKFSKEKSNIEVKTSKETKTSVLDSSKIIITERLDSLINIKGKNYVNNVNIDNINTIKNLILINNDLLEIIQDYDTVKKVLNTKVNLKDQKVKVTIDKTTIVQKNVKFNSVVKLDSLFKDNSKNKTVIKEKKPVNILLYIFIVIGLLALGYFSFKFIYPKIKSKFLI